jgi:hypothetical protein
MIAAVNRPRGPLPGTTGPRQALNTATEFWTDGLPEWVLVLATACDRSSQNVVAKKLGYSASVISAVLKCSYKGAYTAVEKTIRGKLMAETLDCPVLGDLQQDICLRHQKTALHLNPTSSLRVQLAKACRGGCVHSRLPNRHGGDDAE